MYNNNQKRSFIEASGHKYSAEKFSDWLAQFSPYEASWEMDLVLQSIEPLQAAFNQITRDFTPKQKKSFLALLKDYREWYLSQSKKKAVCAGVLLLKNDQTEALRSKMVSSARHLKMILDEVFDSPEKGTLACIYRAYLWFAFVGIPREEIMSIAVDDIDFRNMCIRRDGATYELPTYMLPELYQLCERKEFVSIHKNPDYERLIPRIEGDQLLRGTSESSLEPKSPSIYVQRSFAGSEYSLTYESVAFSGLCHRKFELERAGLPIDFREEIEARSNATEESIKLLVYRQKQNYAQWKEIFSVD